MSASNNVFGDSWPGKTKSLVIVFQHEGHDPRVAIAKEGDTITIIAKTKG